MAESIKNGLAISMTGLISGVFLKLTLLIGDSIGLITNKT
jgi:hypothetical protein